MEPQPTTAVVVLKPPEQIPKILHWIWLDFSNGTKPGADKPPAKYDAFRQSWIDHHPASEGWLHVMWNGAMIDKFLRKYFAFFYETFQSLKEGIYKADSIRYFILLIYGGFYVDQDLKCFRNMDDFGLRDCPVALLTATIHFLDKASNFFMGARPLDGFIRFCCDRVALNAKKRLMNIKTSWVATMVLAGPTFLNTSIRRYGACTGDKPWVMNHLLFANDDPNKQFEWSGYGGQPDTVTMPGPLGYHGYHASWNAKQKVAADFGRGAAVLGALAVGVVGAVMIARRFHQHRG